MSQAGSQHSQQHQEFWRSGTFQRNNVSHVLAAVELRRSRTVLRPRPGPLQHRPLAPDQRTLKGRHRRRRIKEQACRPNWEVGNVNYCTSAQGAARSSKEFWVVHCRMGQGSDGSGCFRPTPVISTGDQVLSGLRRRKLGLTGPLTWTESPRRLPRRSTGKKSWNLGVQRLSSQLGYRWRRRMPRAGRQWSGNTARGPLRS